MRLAYSTLACPRWTVEEAVAAAVRYGYDAIEWRLAEGAVIELDTPVSVRRRLREVSAANGIAIACLDTSCRVGQASPEERTAVTEAEPLPACPAPAMEAMDSSIVYALRGHCLCLSLSFLSRQ